MEQPRNSEEFIDVWVTDNLISDDEAELKALPSLGQQGVTVLRRIAVAKSELRKKVDEMAALVHELIAGWQFERIRLDEISFTLQISTEGGIKWVMGLGASGSTTLKFKIDPDNPSKTTGAAE